jgi:predicted GH43/DUF377 family glycosyl hydrolase
VEPEPLVEAAGGGAGVEVDPADALLGGPIGEPAHQDAAVSASTGGVASDEVVDEQMLAAREGVRAADAGQDEQLIIFETAVQPVAFDLLPAHLGEKGLRTDAIPQHRQDREGGADLGVGTQLADLHAGSVVVDENARQAEAVRARRWWAFIAGWLLVAGCGDDPGGIPATHGWVKHPDNPVLLPGPPGSWDELGVGTPCVLRLGADSLVMWYTGRGAAGSRIGFATSQDGVHWIPDAANPVFGPGSAGAWDAAGVEHPCVLRDALGYTMFYSGRGSGAGGIGVAFSPDGIQWTRPHTDAVFGPSAPGTAWDDSEVRTPWVLDDGVAYRLWYGGRGTWSAVGYASSLDGIVWDRLLAPVLSPEFLEAVTGAPCVLRSGGSYRMWYAALHERTSGWDGPVEIDYAQSSDGIEWTAHRTVLGPGAAGAWDDHALRAARVLDERGAMTLWYEGEQVSPADSTRTTSAIGVAVFE